MELQQLGKILLGLGALLVLLGGILFFIGKFIGKIPGDIVIQKGNFTFYFPIVTCLIISVVLTLLGMIFRR